MVGDCSVPALRLSLFGAPTIVIPQVAIKPKEEAFTVDFLIGVKRGKSFHWFVLEIDGPGHDGTNDAKRDRELPVPVLRFAGRAVGRVSFLKELKERIQEHLVPPTWI